jgi:hypothetical protein
MNLPNHAPSRPLRMTWRMYLVNVPVHVVNVRVHADIAWSWLLWGARCGVTNDCFKLAYWVTHGAWDGANTYNACWNGQIQYSGSSLSLSHISSTKVEHVAKRETRDWNIEFGCFTMNYMCLYHPKLHVLPSMTVWNSNLFKLICTCSLSIEYLGCEISL